MLDGLNSQEVEYRTSNGLANDKNIKYSRDTKSIVLSNTLTLFNFINTLLFILVLTTGSFENSLFAIIIVINTLIAIFQEIKAKKIIDSLTITNQDKIRVKREGELIEVKPEELVLDDIMYLKSGDDVVVDAIIIKADMCEVDESIITGESETVNKDNDDKLISSCETYVGISSNPILLFTSSYKVLFLLTLVFWDSTVPSSLYLSVLLSIKPTPTK